MEADEEREGSSAFKPKPRIQSLSDLIFGLALSISALTLIGQQPATFQQLMASLGLYAFSFLILISVWRLYSTIMSILPTETSGLIDLNILLLFAVSIEPYLFNELFANLNGDILFNVSNFYALDIATMFLIMAFFNHSLANEEKKLVPKSLLKRYKFNRDLCLFVAAIFIVSTAPFFGITLFNYLAGELSFNLNLRDFLWIFALFLGWIRRHLERAIAS